MEDRGMRRNKENKEDWGIGEKKPYFFFLIIQISLSKYNYNVNILIINTIIIIKKLF